MWINEREHPEASSIVQSRERGKKKLTGHGQGYLGEKVWIMESSKNIEERRTLPLRKNLAIG